MKTQSLSSTAIMSEQTTATPSSTTTPQQDLNNNNNMIDMSNDENVVTFPSASTSVTLINSVSDESSSSTTTNNLKRKLELGENDPQEEEESQELQQQSKRSKKSDPTKPKKYGILISYTGTNFSGLQIQPKVLTIESLLIEALNHLKAIDSTSPKRLELNRACRTDRGVHAVRNMLVCRMIPSVMQELGGTAAFLDRLNQVIIETAKKHPQKGKKPDEEVVRNVVVQGFTQVHDYFIPKNFCKKRTYLYLLPKRTLFANTSINALLPSRATNLDTSNNEAIIQRLNQLFKLYEGRHSFHNFTDGGTSNDIGNPSNYRHMYSVQLDGQCPMIQIDGQDYFLVRFLGQSFMLHQIRRMIGLVVAVMIGVLDESIITKSMSLAYKTIVPQAPGVNLMLESMNFHGYDTRTRQTLEKVGEWPESVEQKCEEFKQVIFKEIVRADAELRETADFTFTLSYEHKKYGNLEETGKVDPPIGRRTLGRMELEAAEMLGENGEGKDSSDVKL